MSSRRPTSPAGPSPTGPSPSHSRTPSIASQTAHSHAPLQPSGLREAHTIVGSPEEIRTADGADADVAPASSNASPNTYPTHPTTEPAAEDDAIDGETHGYGLLGRRAVTETTALLRKPFEFVTGCAHGGECNHGTFSPRLDSRTHSVRSGHSGYGFGGSPPGTARQGSGEGSNSMFGSLMDRLGNGSGRPKKMSTTSYLAERHGITNTTAMYVCGNSLLR
jgi:hypothetical protein